MKKGSLFSLLALAILAGCASDATSDTAAAGSDLSSDASGAAAFRTVSRALGDESAQVNSTSTQIVRIDARTTGHTITDIVPAKNLTTANARGATPKNLEGVYWMRGNPLADYLISFANLHWTSNDGVPYAYLSISAPGSFAWKQKAVARGAVDGDYTYLPPVCRVPSEDRTLWRIANEPSTHDPATYRRSIAEDFAVMRANPSARDPRAQDFVTHVQTAGQLAVDGLELLATAHDTHAFYESRWNAQHTEGSVQAVFVATAPGILRDLFPPFRVPVPELFASFSLAPHLDGDPDVFVRKSYLAGTSAPNYYWLTRIVDGEGRELPHFKEFVECVQERSGGELLKVLPPT